MENYKKVKIIQVGPHFFYDKWCDCDKKMLFLSETIRKTDLL